MGLSTTAVGGIDAAGIRFSSVSDFLTFEKYVPDEAKSACIHGERVTQGHTPEAGNLGDSPRILQTQLPLQP